MDYYSELSQFLNFPINHGKSARLQTRLVRCCSVQMHFVVTLEATRKKSKVTIFVSKGLK